MVSQPTQQNGLMNALQLFMQFRGMAQNGAGGAGSTASPSAADVDSEGGPASTVPPAGNPSPVKGAMNLMPSGQAAPGAVGQAQSQLPDFGPSSPTVPEVRGQGVIGSSSGGKL